MSLRVQDLPDPINLGVAPTEKQLLINRLRIRNLNEYTVMAALRGPDGTGPAWSSQNTKWMTACVIRSILGMTDSNEFNQYGPWVMSPQKAKERWVALTPEERTQVRDFLWTNRHYLRHFMGAIALLDTDYETWFDSNVLHGYETLPQSV